MRNKLSIYVIIFMTTILWATEINVPADYNTIQEAINASTAGDIILVSPGTYVENINYNGKDIIIKSTDGAEQTIIDGNKNGSVVKLISGETTAAVLDGFTIKNGTGDATVKPPYLVGGGILVRFESGATLKNLVITDNTALGVGSAGGGISVGLESEVFMDSCIIANNISYWGGGIMTYYSNFKIQHSQLINNKIYTNNSEGGGAGIMSTGSEGEMFCTSVTNNSSQLHGGGGWFHENSKVKLISTTFSSNILTKSSGMGGGIVSSNGTMIDVVNTIIWNNTRDEILCYTDTDQNTIRVAYSDVDSSSLNITPEELVWLDGNINSNPNFVNIAAQNFQLNSTSPCIDKGTALYVVNSDTLVDIRSHSFNGDAPDIGAFEWYSTLSTGNDMVIPHMIKLEQNYPNPFNPNTTIAFSIPKDGEVSLFVYDLLGNKVATLLYNDTKQGEHRVNWNGTNDSGKNVPAGIYIYKLEANGFSTAKKMIYLK